MRIACLQENSTYLDSALEFSFVQAISSPDRLVAASFGAIRARVAMVAQGAILAREPVGLAARGARQVARVARACGAERGPTTRVGKFEVEIVIVVHASTTTSPALIFMESSARTGI